MRALHGWDLVLAVTVLCCASGASAGYLIEVTFDDEDDGTGPGTGHAEVDNLQNNFSMLGGGVRSVELSGSAVRSAFEEGRYGRAADLPDGAGAVAIDNWDVTGQSAGTIAMWVKARDVAGGRLFHVEETVAVSLSAGELVLESWDESGGVTVIQTGAFWPDDGEFHHLAIVSTGEDEEVHVWFSVDFVEVAALDVTLRAPPADAAVTLGDGFDGLLDELVVLQSEPTDNDVWDFDPDAACPDGLSCSEEVIDFTPVGFTHRVPVRMKSAHDPDQCSADAPCPLLIAISGGGKCADNYASRGDLEYYARDGFIAVTVDPYCEGDNAFGIYPEETSQIVAAKDHLMQSSPLAALIDGPEYVATGCSHGCGSVTHLMMFEQDYPHRTFGNSCSLDTILCAYEAGVLCPATEAFLEQRVGEEIGSLDWESQGAQQHYIQQPISVLTSETAASREFAAAWGLSLDGEVCTPDGYSDCYEESMWGMTYSSRRVRDIWQQLEPAGAPTGYFVENHESDCRHCATTGSPAWECGSCLLKHGRGGMAEACPECLAYEDTTIEAGAPAMECPIEASWYHDPLTALAEGPADDDDSAADEDASGCDCNAARGRGEATGVLAAVVVTLLLRRWR